jgi:hypothetical protein
MPARRKPGFPDAGLVGELEPGSAHRLTDARSVGESRRVEDDVGVGGERLVGG